MLYKNQTRVTGFFLAAIILILFVYSVIVFYVPKAVYFYQRAGKPLPILLKIVVVIAHVIQRTEILIIPVLALAVLAAMVWLIRRSAKSRKFNDQ
jgi:type II secretory pathway component PulF